MNTHVVVFHKNCTDGTGAAYAAWCALGERAAYLPMSYSDPVDMEVFGGKHVVMADFSLSVQQMREIKAVAQSFKLLDHHKTARDACAGTEFEDSFDMNRSGAGMAWDYFFDDKPRPKIINYIEDGDLWRHSLPDWEEIRCELEQLPFEPTPENFRKWDKVAERLDRHADRMAIVEKHRPVVEFRRNLINIAVSKAYDVHFAGYVVPAVNSTVFPSEIGNALCRGRPFAIVWSASKDGKFYYSLRSDKDDPNAVDVGEIALMFGGGGHRPAAGLVTTSLPIPYTPKAK